MGCVHSVQLLLILQNSRQHLISGELDLRGMVYQYTGNVRQYTLVVFLDLAKVYTVLFLYYFLASEVCIIYF